MKFTRLFVVSTAAVGFLVLIIIADEGQRPRSKDVTQMNIEGDGQRPGSKEVTPMNIGDGQRPLSKDVTQMNIADEGKRPLSKDVAPMNIEGDGQRPLSKDATQMNIADDRRRPLSKVMTPMNMEDDRRPPLSKDETPMNIEDDGQRPRSKDVTQMNIEGEGQRPLSKVMAPKALKFQPSQPHIIYVLADDLGWKDVGYHGSPVRTPTIDALAGGGVRLERFYVQPLCSPSRACLLSGRHVIHTGLQHGVIFATQPNALTLNATLLPQVLSGYGYKNYMVGKWHLGLFAKEYLPHNRGFDKHCGILTGLADHYSRKRKDRYDLVENGAVYWENETYSTHLYVQKATEYVEQHLEEHPDKPMFLYVSWQAVHNPKQVPDRYSAPYKDLGGVKQTHAGMVAAMDEGIANITGLFKKHGIWENTVLFFSTDNGGMACYGSSNEPLRAEKGFLYEGGIRGVAFAHGKGIPGGRTSHALMHITDVFPTIAHLAQPTRAPDPKLHLDGFNMWGVLSRGEANPRADLLINIDPLASPYGESHFPEIYDTRTRSAIISGRWKLITGNPTRAYSLTQPTALHPNLQLYDLKADPSEEHNLAWSEQELVKALLARLQSYNATAVNPHFPKGSLEWSPHFFLPYDTNPDHLF